MKIKIRILDYILITCFGWGMYLIWLIPFQLFWINLTWDMFIDWLVYGTLLEICFTYPIMKTMTKYSPRITLFLESNIK